MVSTTLLKFPNAQQAHNNGVLTALVQIWRQTGVQILALSHFSCVILDSTFLREPKLPHLKNGDCEWSCLARVKG